MISFYQMDLYLVVFYLGMITLISQDIAFQFLKIV